MIAMADILARADEEILSHLIGRPACQVLNALDDTLVRPSKLRALLRDLIPSTELLRDRSARTQIISLLKPDEATELCDHLQLDATNPYHILTDARFRKSSRREQALFRFFRVVPPHEDASVTPPDVEEGCPEYGLFKHQRVAVREIRRLLSGTPHRAVLHMPTGSGKTRTALNMICEELRRIEPSLVIWLAYSEELCEQTAGEFERAWAQLGDRSVNLLRYWGNHDINLETARDGLMVAGLGKMYSAIRAENRTWSRLADRTSLVVIDEAHQAIAETYRAVLELLVDRHEATRLLGLTATPGRTWNDPEEDARLANFFGSNKVPLRVEGYDNPVDYLVDEGYLASTAFEPLTYDGGMAITDADRERLVQAIDIPDGVLERLAEDEQRNLLIVSRIESLAREHRRILVFAATVEHARLLAVVLRARDHEADAITGATPRAERERIIRHYRSDSDESRILCNFGVLTAGFDAPTTSAAVIARPTKSLVLYSQMVGRAMRGPKAGGNAEALIVTVVDQAMPGFCDMSEAFINWEDIWNEL